MDLSNQLINLVIAFTVSALLATSCLHAESYRRVALQKRDVRGGTAQHQGNSLVEEGSISGHDEVIRLAKPTSYREDEEFVRDHAYTRHQREQAEDHIHNLGFFYQRIRQ